jgi:hypothetical protein
LENTEENCEMIWNIWKKGKWNSEKDMKIIEETQVENKKKIGKNMEERQV